MAPIPSRSLETAHSQSCDYAIKGRHYGVGAALAMALDALEIPQWRETVEATGQSLAHSCLRRWPCLPLKSCKGSSSPALPRAIPLSMRKSPAQWRAMPGEVQDHLTAHQKAPGTSIRLGMLHNQGAAGGGIRRRELSIAARGNDRPARLIDSRQQRPELETKLVTTCPISS